MTPLQGRWSIAIGAARTRGAMAARRGNRSRSHVPSAGVTGAGAGCWLRLGLRRRGRRLMPLLVPVLVMFVVVVFFVIPSIIIVVIRVIVAGTIRIVAAVVIPPVGWNASGQEDHEQRGREAPTKTIHAHLLAFTPPFLCAKGECAACSIPRTRLPAQ